MSLRPTVVDQREEKNHQGVAAPQLAEAFIRETEIRWGMPEETAGERAGVDASRSHLSAGEVSWDRLHLGGASIGGQRAR